MTPGKLGAVVLIFLGVSIGWMILGGGTTLRTQQASSELGDAVTGLWGTSQVQSAPTVSYLVKGQETYYDSRAKKVLTRETSQWVPVQLASGEVNADFRLDYRRKGLLWFSTYLVGFHAHYTAANPTDQPAVMRVHFPFPAQKGVYDSFLFTVNGGDFAAAASPAGRTAQLPVAPRAPLDIRVGYKTRGLSHWLYRFGDEVTNVRNFTCTAITDFANVDFMPDTLSPSTKRQLAGGWELQWRFKSLVSGAAIGLRMPERLNPGPIASRISFFAPVSLLFFFTVLLTVGMARGVYLHPMHYFLLGAAFFAFHLLFAYLADHLDINLSFLISAVVSMALVISYLRLVVNWRFALRTAAPAQLVFLVLFSYAFFYQGYTGLTITIGAVLTLALLMHITAHVKWDEVFVARQAQ